MISVTNTATALCYAVVATASTSATVAAYSSIVDPTTVFPNPPLIARSLFNDESNKRFVKTPDYNNGSVIMPNFVASTTSLDPSTSMLNSNATPITPKVLDNLEANTESADEYLIILPFIVLFGLCGNTISLIAIFHSRLRKMAANQYLIVLTLADSVFLLGVIMVLFKVDFTGYLFCVGIEYVLMCASYISSWSIAALTIERYLAIAHPLKHVQYGYVSRWRMMCFWVPIPFILNLIQFVTLTPNVDTSDVNWPNVRKCTVKDGQLQMIVEIIDVLLCYMMPCFIVVVLNLLIASKVESAEKTFAKTTPPQKYSAINSPVIVKETKSNSVIIDPDLNDPSKLGKLSRSSRLISKFSKTEVNINVANTTTQPSSSTSTSSSSTRILLVVPIVYIILNTPFYMIRMIDTIALNIFQCKAFSIQGGLNDRLIVFLYNAAHYLYYVNFACDVVVYAFSSANFRRTVVFAWRRLLCSKWAKEKEYLESMARSNNNNRFKPKYVQEQAVQRIRINGHNSTSSLTQANSSIVSEILYKPSTVNNNCHSTSMNFVRPEHNL